MTNQQEITISVNGESRIIDSGKCISDLLTELQITHPAVAVEINSEIKPRSHFEIVRLQTGDVVEIVSLVGGG